MKSNIDFSKYSKIAWVQRALDPSTPTTEAKESIRTASGEYKGKEILFPTIRMINGVLVNLPKNNINPMDYAIEKNDFITFNSPEEATAFSKQLSGYIGSEVRKND